MSVLNLYEGVQAVAQLDIVCLESKTIVTQSISCSTHLVHALVY